MTKLTLVEPSREEHEDVCAEPGCEAPAVTAGFTVYGDPDQLCAEHAKTWARDVQRYQARGQFDSAVLNMAPDDPNKFDLWFEKLKLHLDKVAATAKERVEILAEMRAGQGRADSST